MLDWFYVDLEYRESSASFFQCLLSFEYPIWLDSCAHAKLGRFDVLSASPYACLSQNQLGEITSSKQKNTLREKDFLTVLEAMLPSVPAFVGDFVFSGALGYLSYEFGMKRAGLSSSNPCENALPDAWFGLYSWAIIIDHHEKKAHLVYQKKDSTEAFLQQIKVNWHETKTKAQSQTHFSLLNTFQSNITYDDYENSFLKIQKHLNAGNTYQVNYSHCFSADFEGDVFSAYCILRQKNPSEYAVFLRLPEGDLLSFSPELLVKATSNALLTKPIKGTMKRAFDIKQDSLIKKSLLSCSKNRAENMMIVDLLRNDLSKVSFVDSVKVESFLALETMPSVFHLVSTISSTLLKEFTYFDALDALFPGGSITGAPKYSTMQIINALEVSARGIYCGSIGHLSPGNSMCFNIAIRTLTASNGKLYCNAGGGIVLDSNAKEEYQETLDKVSLLTRTLQNI